MPTSLWPRSRHPCIAYSSYSPLVPAYTHSHAWLSLYPQASERIPTICTDFHLASHLIMIFLRFLHGPLSLFNPASLILAKGPKLSDHYLSQRIYGICICLPQSAFRF